MVIVSAPGKILLAGGYLVLEESNCGLVVAVNRRFYCQCDAVVVENDDDDAAAAAIEEERSTTSTTTPTATTTIITVQSPQFGSEWHYTWDGTSIHCDANNTSTNTFIEKTLRVVLSYLAAVEQSRQQQQPLQQQEHYSTQKRRTKRTIRHLKLKVAADNDFYSLLPHLQQRQLPLADGDKLPRCLNAAKDKNGTVLKTGLGSSACLVTVLVAALVKTLLYQEDGNGDDGDGPNNNMLLPLERICALAQLSHCYAQGKIGSGFDVSAACYGSHIYQRFPPAILHDVLAALDDDGAATTAGNNDTTADGTAAATAATHCQTLIQSIVNDHATKIFGNNSGVQRPVHAFHGDDSFLQVMMADVSMGSESPGMAKAILQWKQKQQQQQQQDDDNESTPGSSSIPHWDDLVQLNRTIIELLSQLPAAVAASIPPEQQQQPNDDDQKNRQRRSRFAALPASEWSSQLQADEPLLTPLLLQLRTAFAHARHHLKELGEAANVAVEPDLQTALCDATSQLPGVVATLVPGAGGYDAVVCIYVNDRSVRDAIAQFWTQDWMTQQQQQLLQHQQDGAIVVPVVVPVVVSPLTVAGVDHGQGLLVEDQFPVATIV
jgi:phosphomevalonate kinase